jgi:hypothetical protein
MRLLILMMVAALMSAGCGHAQHPPERKVYVISTDTHGVGNALGIGGSGFRNCDDEHNQCFDGCWNNKPPYPHKKGDGWHNEYCTRTCRAEYMRCVAENEEKAKELVKDLKFSRVDEALTWLREHKAEIALGAVVTIAGVAFVISTGGGALILVPLAL